MQTPISGSDPKRDYWKQNDHNTKMAAEFLRGAFPELAELDRVMKDFKIDFDDLLDYMYNLRTVRTHGYGNVQTTVFEGKITKIESLIRTVKAIETESKKG